MEQLIQDMMDKISQENLTVEGLSDLAWEKKRAIIRGDAKELNTLLSRENLLIQNLNRNENDRLAAQIKLAEHWGVTAEELKAHEIVERVSTTDREKASALKTRVEALAFNSDHLKQLNQMNSELLNHSLAFLAIWENILTRASDSTYSASGAVNDSVRVRGLLDKKI
jgi:flagellar biosynthesis/type III secretory pathway chaperone